MKSKVLKRVLSCFLATALFVPVIPTLAGCADDGDTIGDNQYRVSLSISGQVGGTVTGDGVYNDGESATVVATENPGYTFAGWYSGNELVSPNASYVIPNTTDSISLVAHFTPRSYTIGASVTPAEGGEVTGAGSHYYYQDKALLRAYNYDGYEFMGWKEDGQQGWVSNTALLEVIADADKSYTAWMSVLDYNIYVENLPADGGTVEGEYTKAPDNNKIDHGSLVTLTAVPNEGYTFVGWKEGATTLSINSEYTFTATSDKTYTAEWKKNDYVINVGKNMKTGGTVYCNNVAEDADGAGGIFYHGDEITLKVVSTTDIPFLGWFVGDTLLSDAEEYTFVARGDMDITARWDIQDHMITVEKNIPTAGSVKGAGKYAEGETAVLKATTNPGYTFLGWFNGNTSLSSDATYSFTVEEALTVTAKWEYNVYNIVVEKNPAEAGTITGAGNKNHGSNVELVATTNEGYTFLGWFEDGDSEPVSTASTYSFVAMSSRNLTAKWEINTYTITVAPNVTAGGTVSGGGTFTHGDTVELTATVNSGYAFKGWFENGELISEEPIYTYTATKNQDVVARFSKSGELPVPEGNHHLEIRVYSGGYGLGWIEEAADVFTAKYPNYSVNILGDTLMYDKVKKQLDEDNCPADIALISDSHYKGLAQDGKLACLDDVLGSKVPGETETIESVIPAAHYNYRDMSGTLSGSQYGIPWQDNTAPGFIYNKKYFRDNNISVPTTMAEFFSVCDTIAAKGDMRPLTYSGGISYGYTPNILNQWFIEDVGYEYMSETFFNYDHVDNFVNTESSRTKAYRALAQMLKTPGYATDKAHTLLADQAIDQFLLGEAAMLICGSWFPTEAQLKLAFYTDFEYGFFGVPHINADKKDKNGVDSSKARYSLFSNSLVIPETSNEKDVAKLFLAELYSAECLEIFVEQNNGVSRPMTTSHDISSIDTTTLKGAFAKDVFTYFKGTATEPTQMYYEVSTAAPYLNGTLCPCKTMHANATLGDTLKAIIEADSYTEADNIAKRDAVQETEWIKDKWDYTVGNWKADYLK